MIHNNGGDLDAPPPHCRPPNQDQRPPDPRDARQECRGRIQESAAATGAHLSRLLRDEGIARANENVDDWWRSCADAAIDNLAALGHSFSADVQRLIPSPDSPCRMGARFYVAIRAGVVIPVAY